MIRRSSLLLSVVAVVLSGGCNSAPSDRFSTEPPVFTRTCRDSTPQDAVDSLLFAYRAGDYATVYYLSKPAGSQSEADRKAFLAEVNEGGDWTPALWEIERQAAYAPDRKSADVMASVLSDLDGFLYSDSMRFFCFLDGTRWKIVKHQFEGESTLLAPAGTTTRTP